MSTPLLPDPSWKRRPGSPRGRWIEQLRRDNSQPPADLWRQTYQPRSRWKSDATVLGLCDYLTWRDLSLPLCLYSHITEWCTERGYAISTVYYSCILSRYLTTATNVQPAVFNCLCYTERVWIVYVYRCLHAMVWKSQICAVNFLFLLAVLWVMVSSSQCNLVVCWQMAFNAEYISSSLS